MTDTKPRCETHPAYEADYCPDCGTTTKISERLPRLAADDKTVLEVGQRVKSTKDGMAGQVVGLDRSDKYVRVLFSDDKKRVRSCATLMPIKVRAPRKR